MLPPEYEEIVVCQVFGKLPGDFNDLPAEWYIKATEYALAKLSLEVGERKANRP